MFLEMFELLIVCALLGVVIYEIKVISKHVIKKGEKPHEPK